MQEKLPSTINNERYLRQLFELSKRLIASLDLDVILQATVEGVATLSGLDTAAVYLLEDETKLRLCTATPPIPPDFPEGMRQASLEDHPHFQKAMNSSMPVLIADTAEAQLNTAEQSVVATRNLRTLLFLPLIAETEVMGALIVGSIGKPTHISAIESDLAFTLANFAALAVKNARLYQTGQRYAAQLEQTLIERQQAETERKELQEQLLQTQKMDAIGQLAGGVAHDFNNMLCGIIGTAELITESTEDGSIRELAQDIVTISDRSAELTTQLLAFSRKGKIQNVEVDLHAMVAEVIAILRHTLHKNVTIQLHLGAEQCHTVGDPLQIQTALLNLAVNARDAMPEGGVFEIRTRIVDMSEKCSNQCATELNPGHYIETVVRDTGIGMDDETQAHIFEPFFTTKKQGEGTGMGLAALYGTMKMHGGAVYVDSTPGKGTTFKLYFPLGTETVEIEETGKQQTHVSGGTTDRTGKIILIIDDEEVISRAASRHLEAAGFEVAVYTDSIAALDFFRNNHQTIALTVLDLIMPKMDGKDLFYALRAIKPDHPVIIVSGSNISNTAQTLLKDGAADFIPKPFRREDLLHAVETILKRE